MDHNLYPFCGCECGWFVVFKLAFLSLQHQHRVLQSVRRIWKIPQLLMRFAIHQNHNLLSQQQRIGGYDRLTLDPSRSEEQVVFPGSCFPCQGRNTFPVSKKKKKKKTPAQCVDAAILQESWHFPSAKYYMTASRHFLAKYLFWPLLVASAW